MIVNNNPNFNGQDDLRDDDLDYETITGSNYTDNDSDGEDDLENEDDFDEDEEEDDDDDDTSRYITNTYPGEKKEDRPDEIPEKHESENEPSEYPHETEYQQPAKSSDASPPNPREVPSV